MKLTDEMKDVLRIGGDPAIVTYLTTSTISGKCNIHLQPYTDVYGDDVILMPDLFAQKTKVNLNENRIGVLTVANPRAGATWAFRGPCNVFQWGHPPKFSFHGLTAGAVLEKWGDWNSLEKLDVVDEDIWPKAISQRGVIVIKADEVYEYHASESGKRIL